MSGKLTFKGTVTVSQYNTIINSDPVDYDVYCFSDNGTIGFDSSSVKTSLKVWLACIKHAKVCATSKRASWLAPESLKSLMASFVTS